MSQSSARATDPNWFRANSLAVSLEAISVGLRHNRPDRRAAFQQAKADHDFRAQELELHTNPDLARQIHTLTADHIGVCWTTGRYTTIPRKTDERFQS